MSVYLEINLQGGIRRKPLGRHAGPEKVLSNGTLTIELDSDNSWRLVSKHSEWFYYFPNEASGQWKMGLMDQLYLYGQDGKECFLVRQYEQTGGAAFYFLQSNNSYAISTRWRRVSKPFTGQTGCWTGIAVKGAAGIGAGAEAVPSLVFSWDHLGKGATFNCLSGRLGLVGGFSGGVALVIVTGFPDINQINGFSLSGWDWTLSLGAKAKGFEKLGSTGPMIKRMVEGINSFENVIRKVKDEEKAKELIGAGKGIVQSNGYDWSEQSVTVIDVPLAGGGGEAGVYWYWGSCKLLSSW